MSEIKKFKLVENSEIETEDIFDNDPDPYGIVNESLSDAERFGQDFTVGDEVPLHKKR